MPSKSQVQVAVVAIREVCDVLRKAAPWLGGGWIAWCAVQIATVWAGKLTVADVRVVAALFGDIGRPGYAWTLAVLAIGYGYLQRRERLIKTAYLQGRISQLELKIDSTRSSSQLSSDGSTRREDRL